MKRFKALKSSLQPTWVATKNNIEGILFMSRDERRYGSAYFQHIRLNQKTHLCRNCFEVIRRGPQDRSNAQESTIVYNLARLEASADLGCYLCSRLLDTDWMSFSPDMELASTRRLKDIRSALVLDNSKRGPINIRFKITRNPPPYRISPTPDSIPHVWLEAMTVFYNTNTKEWLGWSTTDIVLVPEQGQY